jgi:glycosyltransferase involved in cell wall biosynthesis/ADP-heptose:LPS heptosyltransferase
MGDGMRVAILIRRFMKAGGGAEGYAIALAKELAKEHEVHVFCQETNEPLAELTYHRLWYLGEKPRWLNQLIFAWTSWIQTRTQFDIVHSHENTWHGNLQTIHVRPLRYNLLGNKKGLHLILGWIKIATSPRLLTYILLERARFQQTSENRRLIVAASESLRAESIKAYPHSVIHVVTPGVEKPDLSQTKQEARNGLGLSSDKTLILFVANDFARKGLDTILSAMESLSNDFLLVVAGGTGSNLAYLNKVKNLGLEQRVQFLGSVKNLSTVYLAADVLIHPSYEDSYGMVVLEAMSYGLPVIVSDGQWCGISQQLHHRGNALLLSHPSNVDELLSLIHALFRDGQLRLSLESQGKMFASKNTWDVTYKDYVELMQNLQPKRILMIKSHSMGIGDLLRSTAAWSALHEKFPHAELHLLFLSKHKGYPTEQLISEHRLLKSAYFLTIREKDPSNQQAKHKPWRDIKEEVTKLALRINPDYVIDFEPSGIRTSLVTRQIAQSTNAQTLGIAEFWGRSFFYDLSARSVSSYAKRRGMRLPIEYTERDFVVLDGLGITRNDRPIELNLTQQGAHYQAKLLEKINQSDGLIGLNIGCGTADALERRPAIPAIVDAIHHLASKTNFTLLLTGAPFEQKINEEFVSQYIDKYGAEFEMINTAGETTISEMTGVLELCHLFVSSDSGPYHMAVAMRRPTLAWFVREEPQAYHHFAWCRCLVKPNSDQFVEAALNLIGLSNEPKLNSVE